MFDRRKGRAWGTTRLDSDAFTGFALGSTLTLAVVLILNLLLPTHAVENHVLEVARKALYGIPLPP
jgi:type IV secretory pathway component VirB8